MQLYSFIKCADNERLQKRVRPATRLLREGLPMTEPQSQPFSKGEGRAKVHAIAWWLSLDYDCGATRISPRNDGPFG